MSRFNIGSITRLGDATFSVAPHHISVTSQGLSDVLVLGLGEDGLQRFKQADEQCGFSSRGLPDLVKGCVDQSR